MVEALAAHKELAEAAGCSDIIQDTGWLGIFESEAKFQSSQWDLELQKRRGVKFDILKAEEIKQFEPSLQPIYKHAVYYPENSYVLDNYRLVRTLAEDVTRNGGRVVQDEIQDFEIGADGPERRDRQERPLPVRRGGGDRRRLVARALGEARRGRAAGDRARLSRHPAACQEAAHAALFRRPFLCRHAARHRLALRRHGGAGWPGAAAQYRPQRGAAEARPPHVRPNSTSATAATGWASGHRCRTPSR